MGAQWARTRESVPLSTAGYSTAEQMGAYLVRSAERFDLLNGTHVEHVAHLSDFGPDSGSRGTASFAGPRVLVVTGLLLLGAGSVSAYAAPSLCCAIESPELRAAASSTSPPSLPTSPRAPRTRQDSMRPWSSRSAPLRSVEDLRSIAGHCRPSALARSSPRPTARPMPPQGTVRSKATGAMRRRSGSSRASRR